MVYPPYCSICLVGFVGDTASDTRDAAKRYLEMLRIAGESYPQIKMIVLGPSVATVPKVSGKYRYRILIKVKNSREFREMGDFSQQAATSAFPGAAQQSGDNPPQPIAESTGNLTGK